VSVYLYFYSLVTMDITVKQVTNVTEVGGVHGPMGTFVSLAAFARRK
jgi:hypothetical protein